MIRFRFMTNGEVGRFRSSLRDSSIGSLRLIENRIGMACEFI